MNNNLPISFALNGIQTLEFAIIKEAFDRNNETIKYSLKSDFSVNNDFLDSIVCKLTFSFFQKEIPFIKIKVACFFNIEKKFIFNFVFIIILKLTI